MCKYKLKAKRPHEKVFAEWCKTNDYEVIKRNIDTIESYGFQWQLIEEEQGDESIVTEKED